MLRKLIEKEASRVPTEHLSRRTRSWATKPKSVTSRSVTWRCLKNCSLLATLLRDVFWAFSVAFLRLYRGPHFGQISRLLTLDKSSDFSGYSTLSYYTLLKPQPITMRVEGVAGGYRNPSCPLDPIAVKVRPGTKQYHCGRRRHIINSETFSTCNPHVNFTFINP